MAAPAPLLSILTPLLGLMSASIDNRLLKTTTTTPFKQEMEGI